MSPCLLVWFCALAFAADRNLLAESTGTRLWLAEISQPGTGESSRATTIYTRQMQEVKWQRTITIPGPALSIHDLQGELAVLLADGTWLLVRPPAVSQEVDQRAGQRAPGPIRAMTVDGRTVWAVCMIPGGLSGAASPPASRPAGWSGGLRSKPVPEISSSPAVPTTGSATSPATTQTAEHSATQPATQPATRLALAGPVPSPVLYSLERGVWRPVADVPAEITPGGPAVCAALAVIDKVPTIAVSPLGQYVQIHRLSPGGVWQHETLPKLPADVQFLQIAWCSGKPALCAIGPGQWMVWRDLSIAQPPSAEATTSPAIPASTQAAELPGFTALAPMSPMPLPADVAVTGTSASDLRLIFRAQKSKPLMERLYGPAGQPTTSAQVLALPAGPPPTSQIQNIPMMLVVAMMLIFLGSLRRRPTDQQVQYILRRVRPAPMARRVAAGLIDLSPVIAGGLLRMWQISQAGQTAGQVPPDFLELVFTPVVAGGVALYLLHTTLAEVFTGRSLGKMLFGLQVVTTEGSPPGRTALVVRNLLRLVDVIIFPPLVLMAAFSPVHQRLADVVAGTLVIIPGEPERTEEGPGVDMGPEDRQDDEEQQDQ